MSVAYNPLESVASILSDIADRDSMSAADWKAIDGCILSLKKFKECQLSFNTKDNYKETVVKRPGQTCCVCDRLLRENWRVYESASGFLCTVCYGHSASASHVTVKSFTPDYNAIHVRGEVDLTKQSVQSTKKERWARRSKPNLTTY